MKRILAIITIIWISGCTNQHISSDKVFSNAQILYHDKEENTNARRSALEMPSYFLDLEYRPTQTKLNSMQIKKVERIFKKLVYSDEYTLYASFGANTQGIQITGLRPLFKRAQDLKIRYGTRVKKIKIVYLKNQQPNCVYLRFLG